MNTNPPQILREKFLKALKRFYKKEILLLKYKVAERALTHKLAEHLQMEFPEYNVDCEYNKIGNGDPKRVGLLISEVQKQNPCCGNCDMCRRNKCVVFPDIIVHRRGRDENLIVVEAKTAWSKKSQKKDFKKLTGLVNSEEYQYSLGIGIVFCQTLKETVESIVFNV